MTRPSKDPSDDRNAKAPDDSGIALLIIDMINDLEFPGGDTLLQPAVDAAHQIAALKQKARQAGVPIIYANDNFGRWRSDFRDAVEHCLTRNVRGKPLAQILRPDSDDYFVLKPKHSAFFGTALEPLLDYLGCRRLILTGISGNVCVQFTASDAKMRDYIVQVPQDCIASIDREQHRQSLVYMEQVLGLDVGPASSIHLKQLHTDKADYRR